MKKKSASEQSSLTVYFCGKESCQPGHYFGPAVRPHYLIHVILEGKGIFQKSGVTYSLKKGDAFLIPPMESTYYQADQEDPWIYAWVGFDGKSCPELRRIHIHISHTSIRVRRVRHITHPLYRHRKLPQPHRNKNPRCLRHRGMSLFTSTITHPWCCR